MSETLKLYHKTPTQEEIETYVLTRPPLPRLLPANLSISILEGDERKGLKTPTAGDTTLLVRYKNREGAVASVDIQETDLQLIQLQGARQEGFRVEAGLNVVALFADQLLQIASHAESGLYRITMPPIVAIQGFVNASERALARYNGLAGRLNMRFSDQEQKFVRDVK